MLRKVQETTTFCDPQKINFVINKTLQHAPSCVFHLHEIFDFLNVL